MTERAPLPAIEPVATPDQPQLHIEPVVQPEFHDMRPQDQLAEHTKWQLAVDTTPRETGAKPSANGVTAEDIAYNMWLEGNASESHGGQSLHGKLKAETQADEADARRERLKQFARLEMLVKTGQATADDQAYYYKLKENHDAVAAKSAATAQAASPEATPAAEKPEASNEGKAGDAEEVPAETIESGADDTDAPSGIEGLSVHQAQDAAQRIVDHIKENPRLRTDAEIQNELFADGSVSVQQVSQILDGLNESGMFDPPTEQGGESAEDAAGTSPAPEATSPSSEEPSQPSAGDEPVKRRPQPGNGSSRPKPGNGQGQDESGSDAVAVAGEAQQISRRAVFFRDGKFTTVKPAGAERSLSLKELQNLSDEERAALRQRGEKLAERLDGGNAEAAAEPTATPEPVAESQPEPEHVELHDLLTPADEAAQADSPETQPIVSRKRRAAKFAARMIRQGYTRVREIQAERAAQAQQARRAAEQDEDDDR